MPNAGFGKLSISAELWLKREATIYAGWSTAANLKQY
jgi:hypothetical protein